MIRYRLALFALGVAPLLAVSGGTPAKPAAAANVNPGILRTPAPELTGSRWLNLSGRERPSLAKPKAKVTVVHFWTFGCINCQRNLPSYARWQKEFEKESVEIIGIHTPETPAERVPENVERKVKELKITYPVLLDTEGVNWNQWGQQWWPTVYLLDSYGRVRYRWLGELGYEGAAGEARMGSFIKRLLAEAK